MVEQHIFFWLIMIASIVAMIIRFIKLPYTVALVFSGLAIGYLGILPGVHLEPHTLFAVFLPPLLFEAGIHLKIEALKRDSLLIGALALLGTVISTLVVGTLLHFILGIDLIAALLFGAIISPTDPISVIAIFKRLGVPKRLAMIVEGESLFNDGIAVVLFGLLLQVALSGQISFAAGVIQLITTVIGGCIIGTIIGAIASRLTHEFDDHLLEITLTTIVAYGSYLAAEAVHVSGVIAVVAASLTVGNYGMKTGMIPSSRLAVFSFWEYAAFIVNSLVFIIIGLEESAVYLLDYVWPISVAVGVSFVARAISVYGIMKAMPVSNEPGKKWNHVVFWSGLRGALSMAMALGIPYALADRNLLIVMTYGVVLVSLVCQGLSIERLINKLGLRQQGQEDHKYQQLVGENVALHAASEALRKNVERGILGTTIYKQEFELITARKQEINKALAQIYLENPDIARAELNKLKKISLFAQRNAIKDAESVGILSSETAENLVSRIEEELDQS